MSGFRQQFLKSIFIAMALISSVAVSVIAGEPLRLNPRSRVETVSGSGFWHSTVTPAQWKPEETCIVVCDMWDDHWCKPSAARVNEMAPFMNGVLRAARARGVLIIHCPSDTLDFYKDTPQRRTAQSAPPVATEKPLERWVRLIPEREGGSLPIDDSDGGCDCEEPVQSRRAWTRQHPAIEIAPEDAITDSAEAFYLMKQRGIRNVLVMGVHTNMCVLGRPFSIRQLVLQGLNVMLVRDLTDTMYNPAKAPFVSHFTGNDLVVEHIEQYWCPTILSSDITGTRPFRFEQDRRPHVVVVMSEPEYRTDESLTRFARTHLGREFQVSLVYGDAKDGSLLPGVDVLSQADLLLLSVRRRTLTSQQLQLFRDFIASGKPVVGIRTSSHPFHLRNQAPPEGRADWAGYDLEVNGGRYTNHHGAGPQTTIQLASGATAADPLLAGVDLNQLIGEGSLYQVSPLSETTRVLLTGSIPDRPSEPVAWVNRRADGGRTFYTSLGHVGDFAQPAFRQLLLNACRELVKTAP
ncbi:MAG: ThuA domain-containing protein [Planctomycetaceae bacterium]